MTPQKKLKADRNKPNYFFCLFKKKNSFLTRYTLSGRAGKLQNQQDIPRIKFKHGIILIVTELCNKIFNKHARKII
jgi:hypothetical protein